MAALKNRRKKPTVIIAAGLTLVGTVGAYAYWSASGTAAGEAQTDVPVLFTVTTGDWDGPLLAPGRTPGQTVPFTVTNGADNGVQQLATMTVQVAEADGTAWTDVAGCSAADYSVSLTTNPAPATILPGENVSGVATITMNNLGSDQIGCRGAVVPLYFATVAAPV